MHMLKWSQSTYTTMPWVVRYRDSAREVLWGQSSPHKVALFLLAAPAEDVRRKALELHLRLEDLLAFRGEVRQQFGIIRGRQFTLIDPHRTKQDVADSMIAHFRELGLTIEANVERNREVLEFLTRFGIEIVCDYNKAGYMDAPTRLRNVLGQELYLGKQEILAVVATSERVPYLLFQSSRSSYGCSCYDVSCRHCSSRYVLVPVQHLLKDGREMDRAFRWLTVVQVCSKNRLPESVKQALWRFVAIFPWQCPMSRMVVEFHQRPKIGSW